MKMKSFTVFVVLIIVAVCISTYFTINNIDRAFDELEKTLDEVLDKIDEPLDITNITVDDLDKFYKTYESWQDKMLYEMFDESE